MIDLSFLTEDEQEIILAVLKRDAELKKAEEQRVQNLQKTVSDRGQLRYMTGEWFYETKQLRHQDRIHGSDIIRASMRQTSKPLTILELSQLLPKEPSFVSSENKEVFVPPVLCGVLQEPLLQLSNERNQNQNPFETPQDTSETVLQSPTKQRKNPFDSEVIASHSLEEKDSQLLDRAVDQTQTKTEGPLASSNSYSSFISDFKQDHNDSPVTQTASVPLPMHEIRAVSTRTQDCFAAVDRPGDQQTSAAAPCGILKHLSTSSSSDSPFSHLDTQSPVSLDSPSEILVDKKQVRFCPTVSRSRVEWQHGKELGEHSLLDIDSMAPSEAEAHGDFENTVSNTVKPLLRQSTLDYQEDYLNCKNEADLQLRETAQHQAFDDVSEHCHSEFLSPAVSGIVSTKESGKPGQLEPEEDCHSQAKATDWPVGHNICQVPEQSPDISVKVTSDAKLSTICSSMASSHAVSPKPRQRLLGCFKSENDKSVEVQSPQKEKGTFPKQKEGAADMVDKPAWVKQEPTPSVLMNITTLQLAAQVDADIQQDVTGERIGHLPEKLSNLKAFWERENNSRTIVFTREEGRQMDNGETEIKYSQVPKTRPDVESINNNGSHQLEMTIEDTADMFQENHYLPQPDCSLLVDLSKEGTYRANPILIYEDTGDSLTDAVTESEIYKPQENVFTPACSSKAFLTLDQEWASPVPFAKLSNTGSQEDSPVKISELKHYWEKGYTKPGMNTSRETLSRSILSKKMIFPYPDLRKMDSTENFEGEAKMSPHKTNSNVVLKSLKVTVKGFVNQSPDRSPLRSSGDTTDVQLTCQQYQIKSDTETQEKALSPSQPHTPRSKDQNEEIRRSPSKTCHPRVLPKESCSPKTPRPEGSPLKTFPINIDPKNKVTEDHQEKLTPVPRQRKILSHEAKQTMQTDAKHSTDISHPLFLNLEEKETCFGNVNSLSSPTSPQFKKASEKTFPRLARTYIPQDYEYYLGPHEKAYVPSFQQEKATDAESDTAHRPTNALRDFVEFQTDSSWIVQNNDENPSQDTTTRANSLSRASPTRYEETSSPVVSALRRLSRTPRMSSSKSLESLTLQTREERTKNNSREKMNESVDDASSPPSAFTLSNSKQMKTSVSASVLQQDETDSDSIFEANSLRRNTGSSMSNISLSSGMASMSSVSGSISSIYPADFGDIEVQGSIQFAVNYIQKLGEFQIFVVHCRNLAVADNKKNRSDPYVKCYILPDKTKLGKRKTTVKKRTLNPIYNEILRFKVTMEVLKNQNLNISVWHNDTFGRNGFLGEVDLDLSEWDFRNMQINEYTLKARASAQTSTPPPLCLMDSRGQMRVALRFVTQTSHSKKMAKMETGEVQIWVKDCKNLPPVRGVIIDPFVKCTVLPDTSRKNRQKTRVVKRTANPMFNHTMVYNGFRSEDLREACVEITVWDHDRLNNHYIGGVRLGPGTGKSYGVDVLWMDSTTEEASLWQRMLQSDGEWVEDVLSLRMLVMAKNMSK